jgi:hypothetical protein
MMAAMYKTFPELHVEIKDAIADGDKVVVRSVWTGLTCANSICASRVATMGQLSASIAHEVNQPVAAVLFNAGAALRWLST